MKIRTPITPNVMKGESEKELKKLAKKRTERMKEEVREHKAMIANAQRRMVRGPQEKNVLKSTSQQLNSQWKEER